MTRAAIYARVSTDDQDQTRQIDDCHDALDDHPYEIESREVYADVMTGTTTDRDDYRRLLEDVQSGDVDLVIATEVSRLSRSGSQEVMDFITRCIEHGVGVEFTQSPITIRVEDDAFTKAVQRMLVSLLSELANIEHKQKLERIESGIRAAKSAGKWTGRPPRGFTVDESSKLLKVDVADFLETRQALAEIAEGRPVSRVSDESGIPASTLRNLRDTRMSLYLDGEPDDDRVDQALDGVRPLPDLDLDPAASDLTRDRRDLDELVERKVAEALQEESSN